LLINRPQHIRLGNHTSSIIILNTGSPQDCVLSLLLFSLFTSDCTPTYSSNTIIKFADDTTIVGLISNNRRLITGRRSRYCLHGAKTTT
ncbi:hypothetical protein LDENG_00050630, partial [Lucifuga dentata]